jgi:hypothetical protein
MQTQARAFGDECSSSDTSPSHTPELLARRALNDDAGSSPDLAGGDGELDPAMVETARYLLSLRATPCAAVDRACQLLADLVPTRQADTIGQLPQGLR